MLLILCSLKSIMIATISITFEKKSFMSRLKSASVTTNGVGHWDLTIETSELYWSEEVYRIHGMEPGLRIDVEAAIQVYHPDDREMVAEHVRCAIEDKKDFRFNLRLIRTDGEMRYVQATGFARLDPEGGVKSLFGMFEDVTDRKKSEADQLATEAKFQNYFNMPLVGSAIYTPDKKWIEVNQNLCDMVGYSREEFFELSWVEITHPDDLEENLRLFNAALSGKNGNTYSMEKRYLHKGGGIVYTKISVQCVRDANGSPDHFLLNVVDITDAKIAEQQNSRLLAAIDILDECVVLFDEDDRIIHSNKAWQELNRDIIEITEPGTLFEEHVRAAIKAGLLPDAIGREEEWIAERLRQHRDPKGPIVVARPDGQWIRVHEQKVADNGIVFTTADITDIKNQETIIRESEAQLREVLENSPIGVSIVNAASARKKGKTKRLLVNQTMIEMYGATSFKEVIDADVSKTWVNQDALRRVRKLIEGSIPLVNIEGLRRRFDGSEWWSLINSRPIIYNGQEANVIWQIDITERKHAEKILQDSEIQIRKILENSPIGVVIVTNPPAKSLKKRERLFVNKAMARMFGATDVETFLIPDISDSWVDLEQYLFYRDKLRREEAVINFECKRRRIDGTECWVSLSSQQIIYNGIPCTMNWHSDITERKLAETALMESESQLRELLENSPIGLSIVTTPPPNSQEIHKRLFVNEAMAHMFGATDIETFKEADISDSWIDMEQYRFLVNKLRNGEEIKDFEAKMRKVDGTEWWISLNTRQIIFNGLPCMINSHFDITERKMAEQNLSLANDDLEKRVQARTRELESARDEAEAANEFKSHLITTMNHELRTPLTSIMGSLRMFKETINDLSPEQGAEMVDIAWRNSKRLSLLVNDILDVERLEVGAMDIRNKHVELHVLIGKSIDLNAGFAKEFDVEFMAIKDLPEITVPGDEDRLLQVMANFLSNAAKFSPQGGKIITSLIKQDDHAIVSVSDNGPGIPEEIKETVFNRFVRGENFDSRNKGGAGLGLNICQSIIEQHNGKIGFNTESETGTTFYFTLPISD